jgi:hypothetical protein
MSSTAKSIYIASARLIYEEPDDDADLKASFPAFLNLALAEALDYENMFRRDEGTELLTYEELPEITTADDTETVLPFHEVLLRRCIPLSIKHQFLEDDSTKKAEALIYYNRFVQELADCAPAVATSYDEDD